LVLGLAYGVLSFAMLAALIASRNVITGGENAVAADQLQYLSWIVSASRDWVINSPWDIPPQEGSHFLHPGFLLSGLLHRAGLDLLVSYQLWKPVSILAIVIAFAWWVRLKLPAGGQRTAALAIALFGISPAAAVIGWNSLPERGSLESQLEFVAGEVYAPSWQWGYMMTAIAVALLVFGLIAAERLVTREVRARAVAASAGIAFACSWLQPWQGSELLAAVVVCDLLRPGSIGRVAALRRHLPMLVAGVLPLAYYRWLEVNEEVWRIAGDANNAIETWSAAAWILSFVVFLPAALEWVRRPDDWREVALRAVPVLMIAQYAVIAIVGIGTFPFHAIQGLGLFVAVLFVRSLARLASGDWWRRHVLLAVAGCVVLCVPGTVHRLNLMRLDLNRSAQPWFLEEGERAALDDLAARSGGGGVLAPIKAGLTVPPLSGRPTWVGQISWTPDFRGRVAAAEALFDGELDGDRARALVTSTRARFLYADCGHTRDLRPVLGDLVVGVKRHGCATIYEVGGIGPWQ